MSRSVPIAVLAVVCVFLLAAAGCSTDSVVRLTDADNGREVQVDPGAEITVELESNKTTGYSWSLASAGPVTPSSEPEYRQEPSAGAVGSGGTELFSFKANDSGEGELRIEYRRPWETDVPAEKTWTVEVRVR
ncbi:MAG TPA: protease inhibitor I42 family protein [Coriobacteriia bacterium]|nr:protease inhibitor I42 family protein [Coriobacteriia bacterium]